MVASHLVQRPLYINALRQYRDTPLVKILSGIRRSGKSSLLELLRQDLVSVGIAQDRIISMRFTSGELPQYTDSAHMYREVKRRLVPDSKNYLLLDEVQEVDGWERAVNSLLEDDCCDIYVTGSNSRLMSSEISTYLSGRYIEIPVFTLSYREALMFQGGSEADLSQTETRGRFIEYVRAGGFPVIAQGSFTEQAAHQIVEGIYTSVVMGDIVRRHGIGNYDLFERIVRFVLDNVGKTFSANSIKNVLKSEGRSLSAETVYNYLSWLEKAFVLYRCRRFDLQGKAILRTQEKFYLADPSLKYALMGYSPTSIASMLENIVYLELRRRGFDVYVGKNGVHEIDFVAVRRDDRLYIQVCRSMPASSTRETDNLLALRDQYPKYVVTLDEYALGNIDGVQIVHAADFLLDPSWG